MENLLKKVFLLLLQVLLVSLLDSTLDTPTILSSRLPLSSAEVSKNIEFELFHVEYSTIETQFKE
jgi:hypothetical protein